MVKQMWLVSDAISNLKKSFLSSPIISEWLSTFGSVENKIGLSVSESASNNLNLQIHPFQKVPVDVPWLEHIPLSAGVRNCSCAT